MEGKLVKIWHKIVGSFCSYRGLVLFEQPAHPGWPRVNRTHHVHAQQMRARVRSTTRGQTWPRGAHRLYPRSKSDPFQEMLRIPTSRTLNPPSRESRGCIFNTGICVCHLISLPWLLSVNLLLEIFYSHITHTTMICCITRVCKLSHLFHHHDWSLFFLMSIVIKYYVVDIAYFCNIITYYYCLVIHISAFSNWFKC